MIRWGERARLADLVRRATGRPAPPVVGVDGRSMATSTPIAESGLRTGSVIDIDHEGAGHPGAGGVELVQVAGFGSASRSRLAPGSYRIGPGRRVNAHELALAPVESVAVELTIAADGTASITPHTTPVMLAGEPVTSPSPWSGEPLLVGNRAFQLATGTADPAVDGGPVQEPPQRLIPFNRPPRLPAGLRADEQPTIATLVDWALHAAPGLWHRRPGDPDAFAVSLGLSATPVPLSTERGIALVGSIEFTRSLARALLVQSCVLHGPADLSVVVLTHVDRTAAWEWTKWLPHTRTDGAAQIHSTSHQVSAWANDVLARGATGRSGLTLVLVDEPAWWLDRAAPLRPLMADSRAPVRFVALTGAVAEVPSPCSTIATERRDHLATIESRLHATVDDAVVPYLLPFDLATDVARRLAALDDPDLPLEPQPDLPPPPPLLELLGLRTDQRRNQLVPRWADGLYTVGTPPTAVVGATTDGPVSIDLVDHGPHLLVAGGPGAGVDELVRVVVGSLAATTRPDELHFLLVGAAGDGGLAGFASLPQCVGHLANLDGHLGARLLRCLAAELRHRATQESAGLRLPRLAVVIDEVAVLVQDTADAEALADIAERGGDLGVHLIAGTCRPSDLPDRLRRQIPTRLVLRVDHHSDSLELLGDRSAAAIPRGTPSRALARIGPDLVELATAHLTDDDLHATDVEVLPYVIGRDRSPMERTAARVRVDGREASGSSIERLVAGIRSAADAAGIRPPRQPFPPPLPERLPFDAFFRAHPGDGVPYALSDLPDEQRHAVRWWDPGLDGALLVQALPGSGATSLLATLALGMAHRTSPDDVHLYVVAADRSELGALEGLAHTGAVIGHDETDRIARLVSFLDDELARRAADAADVGVRPHLVVMIDDVGTLRSLTDQLRELEGAWSMLDHVITDGEQHGISTVLTARHGRDVPDHVTAQVAAHFVMRVADPDAYTTFGFGPSDIPEFVRGRALDVDALCEVQFVEPPSPLVDAVAVARDAFGDGVATVNPPVRIEPYPRTIDVEAVVEAGHHGPRGLMVAVGIDTHRDQPALLPLGIGETVFVTGADPAVRAAVLASIIRGTRLVDPAMAVFVLSSAEPVVTVSHGVDRIDTPDAIADWVTRIDQHQGPKLVVVDDADRLGGPTIERLTVLNARETVLVVAGRASELRNPIHWTTPLQQFTTGVLLAPDRSDGDLLGVELGPRMPEFGDHHGYLVAHGQLVPVLVATGGYG